MSTSVKCLVIGMPLRAFAGDTYKLGEVKAVDPSALAFYGPLPYSVDLIVAPLFGRDFDALEILEHLAAQGYRATLRVIAPHLPNRQIVLRELRSHAARQGILIELVELDTSQS
jgi:hypothetical protein